MSQPNKRSQRLLKVLGQYDQIIALGHDNPDPDAMASGWALITLVQKILGKTARLVAGGEVVRAENRHMVRLLNIPVELVSDLAIDDRTAVVLVDSGPEATNHLLSDKRSELVGVIDHHQKLARRGKLQYTDVRSRVAAAASITSGYLREQGIVPDENLATALSYAIRTEVRGSAQPFTRTDRSIISWLTEYADPDKIAEIENAPLSRAYFIDLLLALQNTFVYESAGLCFLPTADNPEIVGEVADMIIRCEQIDRILCGAIVHGDLLISVRTIPGDPTAAELACRTLAGIGGAGGHDYRAGGKVPDVCQGSKAPENLETDIRNRWLNACGIKAQRGTRLVARRQIVKNL